MKIKGKFLNFLRNPGRKLGNSSVMRSLFDWDQELVLETIFLSLDGAALHSSRQVCSQWNTFILNNIWQRKASRKKLEQKLNWQWKNSLGSQSTINLNSPPNRFSSLNYFIEDWSSRMGWIWTVDSDKSLLFFGFTNGTASIVDRITGEIKKTFHLKHSELNTKVQVKVGGNILVTLCDGILSVFEKQNFAQIRQFTSSLMQTEKQRQITVRNNTIVTRGRELFQCMIINFGEHKDDTMKSGSDSEYANRIYRVQELHSHGNIKCLDYDGDFIALLICTPERHSDLVVENMTLNSKMTVRVLHPSNHIHGITLRHPTVILAIGAFMGEQFGSFEVMDLSCGEVIRRVTPRMGLEDDPDDNVDMAIRHVHVLLNHRFMFFCSHGHRSGEWVKCRCVMFDLEQLVERGVDNEVLWSRVLDQGHVRYVDDVTLLSAADDVSLLSTTQTKARVVNFWL